MYKYLFCKHKHKKQTFNLIPQQKCLVTQPQFFIFHCSTLSAVVHRRSSQKKLEESLQRTHSIIYVDRSISCGSAHVPMHLVLFTYSNKRHTSMKFDQDFYDLLKTDVLQRNGQQEFHSH